MSKGRSKNNLTEIPKNNWITSRSDSSMNIGSELNPKTLASRTEKKKSSKKPNSAPQGGRKGDGKDDSDRKVKPLKAGKSGIILEGIVSSSSLVNTKTNKKMKLNTDLTTNNVVKSEKKKRNSTADRNKHLLEVQLNNQKKEKKSLYIRFINSLGIGVEEIVLTDKYSLEAAAALDLQQWHLQKLRRRFDVIDLDGSGSIDRDEFMNAVGEKVSPFTDKLFDLIDTDNSGTIDFDEYIRVMATYCMFTKDEIMKFSFQCFDTDESGSINEEEFTNLMKQISNGTPLFPANFALALQSFDVNEDGFIDYKEFVAICEKFPMIMYPAFRLQDNLQKKSLGEHTWLRVLQDYTARQRIHEYKLTHGGRNPPVPRSRRILLKLFPCCFSYKDTTKVITIGEAMVTRHRKEIAEANEKMEREREKENTKK